MSFVFNYLLKPWVHDYVKHGESIQVAAQTDDTWKVVALQQRDDKAQFLMTISGNKKIYYFLMNERTHYLYLYNRSQGVSIDCFLMATLGNPLHVTGAVLWNFGKIFYDITVVALNAISNLIRDLQSHSVWLAVSRQLRTSWNEFKTNISSDIANITRAFYYGLGIEIAAIEGTLLNPLKSMANIALIERDWNHDLSYHHDIRRFHQYPEQWPKTFFMAFCFQPRGNMIHSKVALNTRKWENTNTRLEIPIDNSNIVKQIFNLWHRRHHRLPSSAI